MSQRTAVPEHNARAVVRRPPETVVGADRTATTSLKPGAIRLVCSADGKDCSGGRGIVPVPGCDDVASPAGESR